MFNISSRETQTDITEENTRAVTSVEFLFSYSPAKFMSPFHLFSFAINLFPKEENTACNSLWESGAGRWGYARFPLCHRTSHGWGRSCASLEGRCEWRQKAHKMYIFKIVIITYSHIFKGAEKNNRGEKKTEQKMCRGKRTEDSNRS